VEGQTPMIFRLMRWMTIESFVVVVVVGRRER
jgi:hypothetical protein